MYIYIYAYIYILYIYVYVYIYINNKGHVYDLDSYSKLLLQWHMARSSSPVLGHQPLGGIRFLLQIIASMAYEGTHTGRPLKRLISSADCHLIHRCFS